MAKKMLASAFDNSLVDRYYTKTTGRKEGKDIRR